MPLKARRKGGTLYYRPSRKNTVEGRHLYQEARDVSTLLARYEAGFRMLRYHPGRRPTNIHFQHIDYSLYECLPMAVTADVLLAVSSNTTSPPTVRIANTNSSKFPTRCFPVPTPGQRPEIDAHAHDWSNYFKAGLRGAYGILQDKKGAEFQSVGIDILVDGTVPAGGGLSSSAAFVCASSLASVKVNGIERVDKTQLTELAIVSERAVGVNSGGMDQAASVFAQRDSGLLIAFKPRLTVTPISIPASLPGNNNLAFVIAQSFVTSNKRVTGPIHYNLRVVECTLAALYLSKILNIPTALPQDASPLGQSLRGLHEAYFDSYGDGHVPEPSRDPASASKYTSQLEQLVQMVEERMTQEEGYTREEISSVLGITVDELNERYTTTVPIRAEKFKLRQRALHVYSEALRVQRFVTILKDEKQRLSTDLYEKLGRLVNEVQDSCRDQYECSTPELDQLCRISRRQGGYGARVTGAGWGGCSVHLIPQEKVEAVRQAWIEEYYRPNFPALSKEELDEAIVVSKPGRGSLVFETAGRASV